MSDILNDDLTEIDNLFGYKPQPKQNPKNGDVSDLLERMRGGVFQQESGGNYQVKPNARTGATGGFQVMPENIPVWTKKYLGKSLTRDQFERDPQAQEAVFTGEMGKYLQKAREKAPDDDTALRMAAAAWYGGEGAMNRYDDPKRFRPDEPSFREYTTSVLKRSGKPAQPVDLSATDSLFSDSTDDLSDIDNLFGYNPQADTVPMEQKGLMSPADVGKQPVTPTFPSQMPSNLGGSTAQATPPMPERPETLEMQRMAAHDPVSTRAAVLYTPGSPLTPIAKGEVDVPLKDGSILRANIDKFNQFLQANGPTAYNDLKAGNLDFSSLIGGKAQPTNDTANKTAVITRDQNGTELVASSVETPDAIETEAAMQKAQFPNIPTTTEVVHSNDVVNGRVPLDNQAQRQQVMSKVALGKDPTEVLLDQQAPLQPKTPQFADLRNNSTQNQERQYTTGEPRILDDVPDQQQPSEPQRRVGAIENDDQAVADTVTVSKGTPQQQAREALAQLAPKYGFDPNEVLKANPDLNIDSNGEAGKVDVTYGDIRRFTGNSADYDQARAEQRTEMPRLDLSLRRPQRLPDEREAEKALEDRIKETSYSIQQKALEHFSNPVNLTPFGVFNAPSIFNDPSDAWVQEEKQRLLKENDGSYSKAYDAEKDYQEMSAAEFVPRMMFQTARSFTKNLISGTGKSLIVGSQLLEDSPLNPVNKLLPDDAKIGLRNVGNYADLVTRLVSSRDSATALKEMKWAKGTDDIDKQQAFQALQEFDKAVGDDPVLKGRFFGGLADAGGSALAFIALGAAMPSLRLGKFAMGRMALNKGLGRTAAKLAMKAGELPLESAVSGGMQALGTGYEEGKNAGLSEADARNYGIMQGLIGTSEMIGAGGELVDAIKTPALRGRLALGILEAGKKIAKAGAKEAPEEFFQEVFQTSSGNAVLEYLKDNEPDTFQKVKNALNKLPKQVAKAAANEGIIALVTGGVMGGAGKAAQILSEQGQDVADSPQEKEPNYNQSITGDSNLVEKDQIKPDAGLQLNKNPEQASPVEPISNPETGLQSNKKPKRLTVKDPVEPGTVVEVDGRGEAVIVQDNGKNVVIDHTPKPGKNGETTYTGRATVRKDKVTVTDEKTPTIQPQSAPMAEKPLVQDQAPDVPTSSEQITKPAGKTDSPTATAAEEPQVIATESGRKTASQSEEVAPEPKRPALKVQSIQLTPREKAKAEEAAPVHKFSSTQVNLPTPAANAVLKTSKKLIPDAELYTDPEDASYGREETPHVTVKYGLHTEDAEEVRKLLANEKPFKAKLGKISIFESEDKPYDVVKAEIESPELHRLNKLIADNTEVTDTFPTYVPHVTLAYVKKGEGAKYVGNKDLAGREVDMNSIVFSSKNGETVDIPLGVGNTDTVAETASSEVEKPEQPAKTPKVKPMASFMADETAAKLIRSIGEEGLDDGPMGKNLLDEIKNIGKNYGLSEKEVEGVVQRARDNKQRRDNERKTQDIIVREPRRPKGQVAEGSSTTILTPETGKSYDAKYVIREASDVFSSHDPITFQPNADYDFVNDRHYDKEEQYQKQVIDRSKAFKPQYFVTDSPTAADGPPVIDSEGNVLGGNSRTMILKRIYQDENSSARTAYILALKQKAKQFGVSPSAIDSIQHPVLVREISDESINKQHAITELNETSTTELTTKEQAVADAGKLSDDAVDHITAKIEVTGPDASLVQALDQHGVSLVNYLIDEKVFSPGERNTLLDDGKITEDGKRRIERLLLGKVFSDLGQMENASPSTRNTIVRIISPLMKVNADPEWNILPDVQEGIELLNEAKAAGQGDHIDTFANNRNFLRPQGWTPQAVGIAKTLGSGLRRATQQFKQYAEDMRLAKYGSGAMFDMGAKSQAEAYGDAFGVVPGEREAVPQKTDEVRDVEKNVQSTVNPDNERPVKGGKYVDKESGTAIWIIDPQSKQNNGGITYSHRGPDATDSEATGVISPDAFNRRYKQADQEAVAEATTKPPTKPFARDDRRYQQLLDVGRREGIEAVRKVIDEQLGGEGLEYINEIRQQLDKEEAAKPKETTITHNGLTIVSDPLSEKAIGKRLFDLQAKNIKAVTDDIQKWVDRYVNEIPDGAKDINSDNAKLLFDDYLADPLANVQAVHEASSIVAQFVLEQQLKALPKGSKVVAMAGGAASGKTNAAKDIIANVDLVYDSVMKNPEKNKNLIDKVLGYGHELQLVYVFMDIADAAKLGMARWVKHKRIVPIKVFANGHIAGAKAFVDSTYQYALDKGIEVQLLHNRFGQSLVGLSIDELADLAHTDVERAEKIVRDASYAEYESDREKYFDDRIPDALEGGHVEKRDTNPLTFNAANDRRNQQGSESGGKGTRNNAGQVKAPAKDPAKSASDLFDEVLTDLYEEETKTKPPTDGFDDIASIMGFDDPPQMSALEKEYPYYETKYKQLKPAFEKALASIEAPDPRAQMDGFVRKLREKFTLDQVAQLKPYVVKFIEENPLQSQADESITESDGTTTNIDQRSDVSADNVVGEPKSDRTGNEDAAGDMASGQSDAALADGQKPNADTNASKPGNKPGPRSGSKSGTSKPSDSDIRDLAASGTTPARSNFRITTELDFDKFSPKTRYRKNIDALKLLQKLDEENRLATPEEQSVLAQYVGWGGLKQVFDPKNKQFATEYQELKDLLPADEYKKARHSVLNAHFTSKPVVEAIWNAVDRLGFRRGSVLEPSMGSGNFFGLMPQAMRDDSALTGVELEPLTSKIAKHLYPNALIHGEKGFQEVYIAPGSVDLAVGNPPFGDEKLFDKTSKELSKLRIHAYFFAKSIDTLRPGGVLAMVVSKGFMDSKAPEAIEAREYIAKRAGLLGAIRLPNTAFKGNANTDVVTDIVFLQKKGEGVEGQLADWGDIAYLEDEKTKQPIPVNRYFANHPEMMLGTMTLEGSMYRANEPTLTPRPDQDLAADLAEAISKLPKDVFTNRTEEITDRLTNAEQKSLDDYKEMRPYNLGVAKDGSIYQLVTDRNGITFEEPIKASDGARDRIKAMIGIRQTVRQILAKETDTRTTDEELKPLRDKLNKLYDRFYDKYGYINGDTNKRLFRTDADFPLLASLEKDFDKGVSAAVAKREGVEERAATAGKADIFTKRTVSPVKPITSVTNANDALIASLNQRGRLDLEYMSDLYSKPADEIIKELGDHVYNDPTKDAWVTSDEYLSGDVKTKLEEAKNKALEDGAYQRNVEALEKVIPADIAPVDIFVKFGSPWVPQDVYRKFIEELLDGEFYGSYSQALGKFTNVRITSRNQTKNQQTWGTEKMTATSIAKGLLSNKFPVVKMIKKDENGRPVYNENNDPVWVTDEEETAAAQGKAEAILEEFADWIWKEQGRRQTIAALYNERFNRRVTRKYDGSHLELPGLSRAMNLRPHILNFIYRTLQSGKALADHVVGAGKTPTAIATAMEMRRLGMAKKPMFTVPNHLVEQWGAEFKKFYPGANVLAATKKDFEKANRQKLFAKIATGDWDAVVVAHSSFTKIKVPKEVEIDFIQEQIDEMNAAIEEARANAGKKDRSVRDMEKTIVSLQNKMDRLNAIERDDMLDFAEMGVDALFVDEAHEYKNLFFTTQKQGVGSLGDPTGSQKAFDMFMKTQMVLRKNNDRNLIFLTGTPVSNSLSEIFHMQRYLQRETLRAHGINSFDSWANTFGQDTQDWELDASGKFKQKLRFVKFSNLPELRQLWNEVADTITNKDIKEAAIARGEKFPIPKVNHIKVIAERSPQQAAYIGIPQPKLDSNGEPLIDEETGAAIEDYKPGTIIYRMDHWKEIQKNDPKENVLRITTNARQAGLDIRLIDENAPDFENGKINRAVDAIFKEYQDNDYRKGTQLVFLDLSTPKSAKKKAPTTLREGLEKLGIDPDSIMTETSVSRTVDFTKLPPNITDQQRERLYRLNDLEQEAKKAKRAQDEDEIRDATLEDQEVDIDVALAAKSNFSAYDDMRDKLIAKGMKPEQIAFIHDYNTDLQKAALFAKVNRGDIRVLFGSTKKMGAGTNVQKKLVALHNIDAPWKPSDLEQRNGRIERQGNEFWDDDFTVNIYDYATEKTYDARMWEINEQKGLAIDRFKSGEDREVEDISPESANAAEMKASATGDPRILESITLKSDIKKLDAQKKIFDRGKHDLESRIQEYESGTTREQLRLGLFDKAIKLADANPITEDTVVTIDGKDYKLTDISGEKPDAEQREAAARAVAKVFLTAAKLEKQQALGKFRGFDLSFETNAAGAGYLTLSANGQSFAESSFSSDKVVAPDFTGVLTRIQNLVAKLSDLKAQAERDVQKVKSEYETAKEQLDKPFAKAAELETMKERHKVLLEELRAKRTNKPKAVKVEEPTLKSGVSTDQTDTPQFKKWFKDSKVVDESGKPLVVYHGTGADFDIFDTRPRGRGLFVDGAYFTRDESRVDNEYNYGRKVAAYLSIKNPYYYNQYNVYDENGRQIPVDEQRAWMESQGYDGAIIDDEFVAFKPEQIKSAIGNNGNFDENNPSILKSGLSRKLDTADVLESERMTVEEMKDLAYAPFDDLIDGRAKVDVVNGNISANAASHEIYRRALEYVRVKAGRTRIGAKQFEDLFTGVFMRPNEVRDIITGLEEKRDEAKQLGYTPAEVQVFDDHINALKESAEAGQGTAVIYILDRALPHELFHRADYMGAMDKALMQRHSKSAAKALDEHRVTSILAAKHFAKFNQFSQLSDSMRRAWIRSEIPPHLLELSEDQLREQYGITPEMAADYMLKWFEGYVEKNGIESLDNFDKEEINVQTFLKQVKDEFSQPAAVADGTVGETDESSPPVERKPEREKRGNDRSDGESPSVSLNPGEKLRRLPKTMRAAGLDAIDMAYEVYGDKTATDDAARLLNDYGIEGSIKLLRDLPAASQDAQHAILSFMLIRTLQDHANEIRATDPATALKHYELSLTLAREHAVKATGAGRFTRIPSVIGPTIEHLTYAVQGVIEDKYGEGKTLNDKEREKWEALGRELEAAHAKMTGLQKENRNQKAKIKRLEEAKEGKKPKKRSSSSQKSRAKLVQLVKDEKQSTVDALRAKLRARFNAEPAQMSAVPNAQFEQRPVMIEELLKRDADLREYIQKENPDAGREVTEPVTIGIKSGGGVVIDGFKRIAQALSNGQMTVLAYVQANEPSLYSAVAPDEDFPIDDFAEVGAMMLTDGLAGPDDYLPHDFEADMVAEFGDVVKPYFTEIYKKAWAKRNEWLDEIRYQQTKERIEAKYNDGNELEDWEIEEILGEQKAKAKRRRAIEAYHRMAAGGKPVNRNLADLKRIISELAPDTETAIGAALQAERIGADEMYARMKEMGITDGKAQREAIRNGKEILDQARIELQAEKDAIANELLEAEKDLKTIGDLRWQARNEMNKAQRSVNDEMRRIKTGEIKYRISQVVDVTNSMRTMMASFDMSGALRQGGFFAFAKPELQGKAFANMFNTWFSDKNYGRVIMEIEANPLFTLAQRSGIDFAIAGKGEDSSLMGEELYRGESTIEKLPVLGKPISALIVKPSERTYTSFLDTQRMVVFEALAKNLMDAGMTFEKNRPQFEQIGKFINVATGRGTVPNSAWGKIIMNLPLFAPRYTLSRFQLINMTLNPVAYYNMPAGTRAIVAKNAARFYGTTMGTLGLIALFGSALGLSVNFDDDDDDFLKITHGNTKYDIFAGALPVEKMLIKLIHSAYRTSLGTKNRVENEFFWDTAGAALRFGRGKLSPLGSLTVDALYGKDYPGNKTELTTEVAGIPVPGKAIYSRLIPLTIGDAIEAYKLDGGSGVAKSIPPLWFGVGVSTYKPKLERPETDAEKLAVKASYWHINGESKKTREQREIKNELVARSRRGEDVTAQVQKGIDEGYFNDFNKKEIFDAAKKSLLVDKVEGLRLEYVLAVYQIGTPAEKEVLLPILQGKVKRVKHELEPGIVKQLEEIGITKPVKAKKK